MANFLLFVASVICSFLLLTVFATHHNEHSEVHRKQHNEGKAQHYDFWYNIEDGGHWGHAKRSRKETGWAADHWTNHVKTAYKVEIHHPHGHHGWHGDHHKKGHWH